MGALAQVQRQHLTTLEHLRTSNLLAFEQLQEVKATRAEADLYLNAHLALLATACFAV